ncbi:MAG: DnaJ C-terminal domain-containing protein [Desulfovibrio sp.]|jgi:curved DNA-binding protein|nr:J domain-containing protein [Mailhella sp.]
MGVAYKDYYKTLGVERTASKDAIAKAYKKLARKYHPDLNPGDKGAEDKFKDINEAYEVLKDDEKRRMYDQLGSDWKEGQQFSGGPGFENFNFNFSGGQGGFGGVNSDFFEMLFGNMGRSGFKRRHQPGDDIFGTFSGSRSRKGNDVRADIDISLEEARNGGVKHVSLNDGGKMSDLQFNIPPGIGDGQKIRLAGKGNPGSPAGDLLLTVHYAKHRIFQVEDRNVVCEVVLWPWEAVFGTKKRVPTLEGEVEMSIPPGSSSGRRLRLRGYGIGPAAQRGDEYVSIVIRVPKPEDLSEEQRKHWMALSGRG